ncbi:hypothetical protein Tco_0639051 [Tanacetum coccineum]
MLADVEKTVFPHTCYRAEEGEELDQIVTKNSQFTTQKNLLWTRVNKAIHGEDGKMVADSRLVTSPFGEAFLGSVETFEA